MLRSGFKLLLISITCLTLINCKKDDKKESEFSALNQKSHANDLLSFSVQGQLYDAKFDNNLKTVLIAVEQTNDKKNLPISFTLSDKATASINNKQVLKGELVDFKEPVKLTITAEDGSLNNYTITVKNRFDYYGIGTDVISEKSLDRTYNFYFDQIDNSTFQSYNCGPAVTAMTEHWSDFSSVITPAQLRSQIRPEGGWWFTNDITNYLSRNKIKNYIVASGDILNTVKTAIDNNCIVILCLDMHPIPFNMTEYERVNKFYNTTTGWGHFIQIKGYKETNKNFYFEAYDPFSYKLTYLNDGQLKGQNRYYAAPDVRAAVEAWWPYVIIVQGKETNKNTLAFKGLQAVNPPAAWGR